MGWLHGDRRGSWLAGELIGADPMLESVMREHMTHDAVFLNEQERDLVERIIRETCAEHGHEILVLTVQSTHVHVVFAPMPEPIKNVVARLKRRSSMEVLHLRRQRGDVDVPRTLWAAKRFVVFLTDAKHREHTIAYVERHNDPSTR